MRLKTEVPKDKKRFAFDKATSRLAPTASCHAELESDSVTPKPSLKQPIHNWFLFPHSYSHVLVNLLLKEWKLAKRARILDPFVGAGTTLLTAKLGGFEAIG